MTEKFLIKFKNVIVRQAEASDDLKIIPDLFKQNYGDKYAYPEVYNESSWISLANSPTALLYIYLHDNKIIGVIVIEKKGVLAEVGKYVINKEMQGKGISNELSSKVLQKVLTSNFAEGYFARNRTNTAATQYGCELGGMIPTAILPQTLNVPGGLEDAVLHAFAPDFSEENLFQILKKGINQNEYVIINEELKQVSEGKFIIGFLPRYDHTGALIVSDKIPKPGKLSKKSKNLYDLLNNINDW